MLNETSGLVLTWVDLVRKGKYTEEEVPDMLNLKKMVHKVLLQMERSEQE